jgi:hypothetical protein
MAALPLTAVEVHPQLSEGAVDDSGGQVMPW